MMPFQHCMLILLLLAAINRVDSAISKICVFRGKSEKLFSNDQLDNRKERWDLYMNGAKSTHIATWKLKNSSTEVIVNDKTNIIIGRNRNIWIYDVGENDEGKYVIKYTSNVKANITVGPEVQLIVFDLTEKKQFQECQGDYPDSTTKYYDRSSEASGVIIHMIAVVIAIVIVILMLFALCFVGTLWMYKKKRSKLMCMLQMEDKACNKAKEHGEAQPLVPLEISTAKCDKLIRENEDLNHQRSGRKGTEAIENEGVCKICLKNAVCITFLPCRHDLTCKTCASTLTHCPKCNERICSTVKQYSG